MNNYKKIGNRDGQNHLRHLGIIGLFSALLALCPFPALGQAVINWNSNVGVDLNSQFPSPAIHSVTVDSGYTIDNNSSGLDAISGDTRPWHLINNGTLNGWFDGVYFSKGGSVNNTASIYGGFDGVYITGDAGNVVNSGSITGYNYDGVYLGHGGSVNNLFGGYILGEGYSNDGGAGVEIYGGLGSVDNAGTIESYNYLDAIYMNQGGSVTNSGHIYGSGDGVDIQGGTGSVVNTGDIHGNNGEGVYLGAGGSVDNSGAIHGYFNGVDIEGGVGSVVNSVGGEIQGYNGDGVYMNQTGSVTNSGAIYGYYNGVYIGGPGSVVNQGSIYGGFTGIGAESLLAYSVGQSYAGVYLNSGGIVDNSGSIYGAYNYGSSDGVYIDGGAGYVTNSGYIYGSGDDGVELNAGGVVNNLYGGQIYGDINGVDINGPATVINAGTIHGSGDAGVYLNSGGTVENQSSGNITGYYNGVEVYGSTGSVVNHGAITGQNGDGVYMDLGGTLENHWVGTISGGINGVDIVGGEGTVNNRGTITGTSNDGVYLGDGGSVYNSWHGTITGGQNGVQISNQPLILTLAKAGIAEVPAGWTVENHGSITGTTNDGVYLSAGGSVYNSHHGTITGGQNGVEISSPITPALTLATPSIVGGSYTVENYGSISGLSGNGVLLWNGGSVYNDGDITGGLNGVLVQNSSGDVVNYGNITGNGKYGVSLKAGGTVENYGTIWGSDNGVTVKGSFGYVDNDGTISGGNFGVDLQAGGTVYNYYDGSIYSGNGEGGGKNGVRITGGDGGVYNAGYIYGGNGTAISLASGYNNNWVTLDTGSDVQGNILGGGSAAAFLQGHGTFDYSFSGFNTLNVSASGCRGWNLTGESTFNTSATVESGLLRVNGTLNTPLLTVNEGATLGGSGIINGIVDNHGIFAPGNSIGTQTINGSMTNWSDYYVQVTNTGASDLILVNGTATINSGDVVVQPDRVIYGSNTVYTILTATNGFPEGSSEYGTSYIAPEFSTNALFLTSSLQYDPNNVYLTLQRKAFVSVANTYNQTGVAGALDGIVDSPGGMSNLVTEFFWLPSASEARAALDSMSGEIHGSMGMLDVQMQNAFNRSVLQRTAGMSAGRENGGFASMAQPVLLASAGSNMPPIKVEKDRPLDIWVQGFGTFGHLGGDGNALGGDYTISGINGGFDYRVSSELLLGLAVGYAHNSADVGGPGADGKVDGIQLAGYGGYVSGPWRLDGIFSYGFLQTDTRRQINVGPIHQQADASYDGGVFSLSAEGGYAFEYERVTVEPTLGFSYAHLSQDGFSETGTAAYDGNNYGLKVSDVGMDSFRSALGVRLASRFGKKGSVNFIPELRLGWEHEFVDNTADVTARFVRGSGDFNVRGVELGADSGVASAGLTVVFNKAIQASVNYDAQLNERLTSHAFSGRVSYSW